MAVIDWMNKTFATVPKMLVTGCSAGGAGAILELSLHTAGDGRQRAVQLPARRFGPHLPQRRPSKQLQANIRSAWNVDPILDSLSGQLAIDVNDLKKDFGPHQRRHRSEVSRRIA